MDILVTFVFVLESPLHVKVELALTLNALLLHVADNTLMHGLFLVDELQRRHGIDTRNG